MKKFVIHYNYYATADVTVLANSKEEAIEKADQIEIPNDEFSLEYDNREAFELEDVPELQERSSIRLLQSSKNSMKEQDMRTSIQFPAIQPSPPIAGMVMKWLRTRTLSRTSIMTPTKA